MTVSNAIVFSGIAPHPPIMVPEVGLDAVINVHDSIAAMAEFTRRLIASGAETVVMITPHAQLKADAFVAYQASILTGDFSKFQAPEVKVNARLDEELLGAIKRESEARAYAVVNVNYEALDHGIAVPLYFLLRNGWRGRLVALGYSFLADEDHLRFGSCIESAARGIGRPIAMVASGDLSHRLRKDAPAGYRPTAHLFDLEVVDAIRSGSIARIINLDQDLRRVAGECGYRSLLVALGAVRELTLACEVLSYEAPFGVGYLVAQITNAESAPPDSVRHTATEAQAPVQDKQMLLQLVRAAVESFVLTGVPLQATGEPSGLLVARAACFVSIKTADGQLRGCIGTIEPGRDNLREEVIANAIAAATRDPRFKPVAAAELAQLRYSLDVLTPPEPAVMAELDAKIYGIVVEDELGEERGLLLPDIEGVDSVEKQIEIASRKAGIPLGAPIKLWRFRVERFREEIKQGTP